MKGTIADVVRSGRILVSDGAWGTYLYDKGMQPGECPELWNVSHRDDVYEIARSYVAAGADMIETNSFGGSSIKLARFGLASRASELNQAAASISRQAAGDGKWVIASIGPSGQLLILGDVKEPELYNSFREQAQALEKGGADALCIETMSDRDEAVIAIRAARENTRLEIICTFTFEQTKRGDFRTMMGIRPGEAAAAALDAGAAIIGVNCGNGMEPMVAIVREMRAAFPETPILVQANAGIPQMVGDSEFYPDTPELMASFVPALVQAGANIIGGCCGTTPGHIAAIRRAVDQIMTDIRS
jgi:5-methyltetrahydrofolate--homocysteine methyltransferase